MELRRLSNPVLQIQTPAQAPSNTISQAQAQSRAPAQVISNSMKQAQYPTEGRPHPTAKASENVSAGLPPQLQPQHTVMPVQPQFCTQCGTPIALSDSRFCTECGAALLHYPDMYAGTQMQSSNMGTEPAEEVQAEVI